MDPAIHQFTASHPYGELTAPSVERELPASSRYRDTLQYLPRNHSATNFFDPPHRAPFKTDLDPMGVAGRFCENILDQALGQSSGPLILFEDNGDRKAHAYLATIYTVHNGFSFDCMLKNVYLRDSPHHECQKNWPRSPVKVPIHEGI